MCYRRLYFDLWVSNYIEKLFSYEQCVKLHEIDISQGRIKKNEAHKTFMRCVRVGIEYRVCIFIAI